MQADADCNQKMLGGIFYSFQGIFLENFSYTGFASITLGGIEAPEAC